jgi:cytochrome bd ubiquinol oxidase subunit II
MIFDYETLRIIWWLILGFLLIGFAITDGFDLGVGMLLPFLGRNDAERRVLINCIGPTWEGNQVWFVTGGASIFAAWPLVYATAFSGFYFALLLTLFALFFRPLGFDFRSKMTNSKWRNSWDWGLFVGGFVPALIFGVAFGNLLQGVPFYLDQDLRIFYTGGFFGLLNPFALLAGLISVAMLVMQGAVFLQMKTEDVLYERSKKAVFIAGIVVLIGFALAGIWMTKIPGYRIISEIDGNAMSTPLTKSVIKESGLWLKVEDRSVLWACLFWTFFAGVMTLICSRIDRSGLAFICSSLVLAGIILTTGITMFPFLMPSSSSPGSSLTIWDASSSHATLQTMFWVVLFFMPIILTYTSWVYRVLKGKVTVEYIRKNDHTSY